MLRACLEPPFYFLSSMREQDWRRIERYRGGSSSSSSWGSGYTASSSATVAINTCGFVGVSDARLAFNLNAASKVDSFDRCLFFVEGVGWKNNQFCAFATRNRRARFKLQYNRLACRNSAQQTKQKVEGYNNSSTLHTTPHHVPARLNV